jgi:Phage terminase large subunit (GpA)
MLSEHFQRVKDGIDNVYNLQNLAAYVEKSMKLEGRKFSFGVKYGFQKDILNDSSRVNNTIKPAQIGLTTTTMAYTVAAACTQKKFHSIYALPTAGDANKLVTTKLNPLIDNSPDVRRLINLNVHSMELKEINKNFIFIRGTKSDTAALSISADALVVDEIDRCDPDVVKQFRSRLQASEFQVIRQFSTPTINGVGISKESETSKKFRHMAKCDCCGHVWLPSYHTDIVVPGFDGDLEFVTNVTLKDIRWQEASWRCPSCKNDPRLHPSRLEWVCENPLDNYEAHSYFITPVTACLVLTPSYLVRTSTEFNTRSEWKNQVLGETSENKNSQITEEDVLKSQVDVPLDSSEVHVMGFDMGLLCAVCIGRVTLSGMIVVVHREMVPITQFETRRLELIKLYRVVASVHDVYPYTPEIMRVCDYDTNAYGAMFSTGKNVQLYTLQEKAADIEEGKLNLRLLKVNRTMMLDDTLAAFKAGTLIMSKSAQNFNAHYTSMKRTQVFVKDELTWVWQKTGTETDHQHFALGYMQLAWQMRTRQTWSNSPDALVSTFRIKPQNWSPIN